MSTQGKPLTIAVLSDGKRELIIARLFRDRGRTVRLRGARASEELTQAPGQADSAAENSARAQCAFMLHHLGVGE